MTLIEWTEELKRNGAEFHHVHVKHAELKGMGLYIDTLPSLNIADSGIELQAPVQLIRIPHELVINSNTLVDSLDGSPVESVLRAASETIASGGSTLKPSERLMIMLFLALYAKKPQYFPAKGISSSGHVGLRRINDRISITPHSLTCQSDTLAII